MFEWLWAQFAAWRLGLRDRGKITEQYFIQNGKTHTRILICKKCKTDIRIGIHVSGEAVYYCWKCERVEPHDGGPDGGETVDDGEEVEIRDVRTLRVLKGRKQAHG